MCYEPASDIGGDKDLATTALEFRERSQALTLTELTVQGYCRKA